MHSLPVELRIGKQARHKQVPADQKRVREAVHVRAPRLRRRREGLSRSPQTTVLEKCAACFRGSLLRHLVNLKMALDMSREAHYMVSLQPRYAVPSARTVLERTWAGGKEPLYHLHGSPD